MIDKVHTGGRGLPLLALIFIISGCSLERSSSKYITAEELSSPIECALNSNRAPKKVAILHFGLKSPEQSQYFPRIQQLFTEQLLRSAQLENRQLIRNASHITLKPLEVSLLGKVNPDVSAQIREIGRQFDSQIVVYGSFSEISRTRQNYLLDKIRDKSKFTLKFTLHFFDGRSGQQIHINHSSRTITREIDFATYKTVKLTDIPYYNEIKQETTELIIGKQLKVINKVASCLPLKGRVTSADNMNATIDLGSLSQLKPGDPLDLYHADLAHTDAMGIEHTVEKKVATLWITQVQANSAVGRIESIARTDVVQVGDRVVSR